MTVKEPPDHVRANYKAFLEVLSEIHESHQGQFALLRDGKIVEFFSTFEDAFKAGKQLFPDGIISIQEVSDVPIDLGFFSQALPRR